MDSWFVAFSSDCTLFRQLGYPQKRQTLLPSVPSSVRQVAPTTLGFRVSEWEQMNIVCS